jgi:RNA polymerase sigma factor (sigma-70 family)
MDKTPHIDQHYIKALAENDTRKVAEIYQRFAGKVKAMILNNNGDEDEAADVFQEALTDIYRKAATGNFILTCPFEAFLIVICKNKWLTQLEKKQRRGVTFKDPEGYDVGADVFKEAATVKMHNDRKRLLETQFQALGEGCRELLQLSWTGKAMDEVAALLKMTYAYARKKKSECMGKLTELVRQSPDFKTLQYV